MDRALRGAAEIEQYANHVADRFKLREKIQFETRVVSAIFERRPGAGR